MKAFISYSHKDDWALNRLHTHLAMLRREDRVADWYDREILAGGDVDEEIMVQLESSELVLLLVSPDFLASNYCYEREMERALERHSAGEARVVPIIVEPCDWQSSQLKQLKALPRDGKPISEWTNHNTAFMDVVAELRRVVDAGDAESITATGVAPARPEEPAAARRRYRVKRDFDEIDRSDFTRKTFETMHSYFERAIAEIDGIEDLRARFTPISAVCFTCTVVNKAVDRGTAHITVHARSGQADLGDIYYSFAENAPPNTANGTFHIESDEYDLYLTAIFEFGSEKERLSPESAAEQLWAKFLENAGVSHA